MKTLFNQTNSVIRNATKRTQDVADTQRSATTSLFRFVQLRYKVNYTGVGALSWMSVTSFSLFCGIRNYYTGFCLSNFFRYLYKQLKQLFPLMIL